MRSLGPQASSTGTPACANVIHVKPQSVQLKILSYAESESADFGCETDLWCSPAAAAADASFRIVCLAGNRNRSAGGRGSPQEPALFLRRFAPHLRRLRVFRGPLILRHWTIDLLQRERREDIGLRIGIPTVPGAEPPQPLRSRRPFHQQVRMPRINLHGDLQDVKGQDPSWRTRVFNRHLPLDPAAHMPKQSVVGAFVRAALAHGRHSKQQSKERNHSIRDPKL